TWHKPTQPADRVADRPMRRKVRCTGRCMCGYRQYWLHQPAAYDDDAAPALRHAEVGGIKNRPDTSVSQPLQVGEQLVEPVTPSAAHHAGDILKRYVPWPQLLDQTRVLPREAIPGAVHRGLRRAAAQDGKTLARRAPEQKRQLSNLDAG